MNKLIMSIIFFSGISLSQDNKLLKNTGFPQSKTSGMNGNNNNNVGGYIDNNKKVIEASRSQWVHKIIDFCNKNASTLVVVPIFGSLCLLVVSQFTSSNNNPSSTDHSPNNSKENQWRSSDVKNPKLDDIDGRNVDTNDKPQNLMTAQNPSTVFNGTHENFTSTENPLTILNPENPQLHWKSSLYSNDKPISHRNESNNPLNPSSDIVRTKDKWILLNSLKFFDNTITETYCQWANDFHGSLKLLENQSFETIVQTIIEDRIKLVKYVLSFWAHNQSQDVNENIKMLEGLQSFVGKPLSGFVERCCHLINQAPLEQRQKFLDETKIGHLILKDYRNLKDIFSEEEQKQVIDFKGLMALTPEEKSLKTHLKTIPQLHTNPSKPNFVKLAINFNTTTQLLEIHRIVFQFCRADGDGFCLYNSFNKDADELNKTVQEILNKPPSHLVKKQIIEPIAQFIIANEVYQHTNGGNYTNKIVESMDKEHNIFKELKIIHESSFKLCDQNHILSAQLNDKLGKETADFLIELSDILNYSIGDIFAFSANPNDNYRNYYNMAIFQDVLKQRDEEIRVQFPLMHHENPIKNYFYNNKPKDNFDIFKPSKDLENKFATIKKQLFDSYWEFFNGSWLELTDRLKDCDPIVQIFVNHLNALKTVWTKFRDGDNFDFYKNFIKTMLDKRKKLHGNQHFLNGGCFLETDVYTNVVTDDHWNINIKAFDWSTIFELNREYLKKKLNKNQITDEEVIEYVFVCKHAGIHFDRWQALKTQKLLVPITE